MIYPLKRFHLLAQKTCLELGDAIPAIGVSAATMHGLFYWLTEYAGESNSLFLRILAIASLVPTIFHGVLAKTKLKPTSNTLAILGLFACGPLFFSLSIVLELSQPNPDQLVIIHRQFEYFASFALILFFLSNTAVVVATSAICACIAYIYSLLFLHMDSKILLEIFAPASSLWIFLLLLVSYAFRKRENARLDGMAAVKSVGSNIAHELRTPLASIRNFTTSLERKTKNSKQNSQIHELSKKISSEVINANTIIDMLLISGGTLDSTSELSKIFLVGELLDEAVQNFPFNNDVERQSIETKLTNDFLVNAPALQIKHVFFNLLKNGIRYSQPKGRNAKLSICVESSTKTVVFSDNGVGVSKANIRKIYDRFYTTEKYGQGTGIGLSFCKMTMESIGGSIECESVLGEYTKFTLKFP